MDKQVEIRHASVADLDAVMAIYDYARQRMVEGAIRRNGSTVIPPERS